MPRPASTPDPERLRSWLPVLLFGHFLLPMEDNAADDLLVVDARRLSLLHGNYSRFGFSYPGPWFLAASLPAFWRSGPALRRRPA